MVKIVRKKILKQDDKRDVRKVEDMIGGSKENHQEKKAQKKAMGE